MQYNILKITTIYAILIAWTSLTMIACPEPEPEPEKSTTKTPTNTGPFTVTFALDGGAGNESTNPQTVFSGRTVTKPKNNPTKLDRTFGGWYKDEALKTSFFFATEKITKNTTLYAKWNKRGEFNVRFNTRGGSAVPEQTIVLDGAVTKPKNNPTKLDHIFGGWYTDEALKTPFKFTTRITKNTTLYAKWNKRSEFNVRFQLNGGTPNINEQTIALDGTVTKPKNNPTKLDHIFGEWYTDKELNIPFDFGTPITSNTTLYAGWSDIWSMVATKTIHTVGIKKDGTLWAWGNNRSGQLGLGNKDGTTSPTKVGSDTTWTAVAAGESHTVGIKKNGTLWIWGKNDQGRLGLGNKDDTTSPTKVGSDTWKAVAAGSAHTVGIKKNGTLWTWGNNGYGQLGLENKNETTTSPTKVGSDTTWTAVAAGSAHTVGIKKNGTLWTWGNNRSGQLGLGNKNETTSPTKVGSDTTWKAVAAGVAHIVGIKDDIGTLWIWGSNDQGRLGLGNKAGTTSPTKVGSDTTWKAVAAGESHTVGIKKNGTLWTWGNNGYGQLGLGDKKQYTGPTLVKESPLTP